MNIVGSSPTLIDVTLSGNHADYGGGILLHSSNPMLTNSIIWDNSPESISLYTDDEQPIITYSDIAGGWEGEGNINLDPLFTDAENGDYTLQSDSPCIDAGTADLDGDGIDDITDYFGLAPDMGAYEYTSCPDLGDLDSNGAWNILDVVQLANCVLGDYCETHENACAADLNGDGNYNVLDIVTLASCVLLFNCGE